MQVVNGIGIIDDAISESYCYDLIRYFYKRIDLWEEGETLDGLNTDKKDAVHIWLRNTEHALKIKYIFHDLIVLYLREIARGIDWDYRSLFTRGIKYTGFKLQRYIKNEGHYNAIHQERDSTDVIKRMFVVMAYLNSVEDGGKTNFPYFEVSVSPVVGRVIIWPAGMPYLHQGFTPIDNHKFIITTWIEQVDG